MMTFKNIYIAVGVVVCVLLAGLFLVYLNPAGALTVGVLYGEMTLTPNPTEQLYATHRVSVYKSDKTTLVATLVPSASGQFSGVFAAGSYWLDVEHSADERVSGAPASVVIPKAGVATSTVVVTRGAQ